jgi:hypothetical protein
MPVLAETRHEVFMTPDAIDPITDALLPGEELRGHAPLVEGTVAVTNERLFVANGSAIAVDITWARLRRVQLDIERQRPATLVVVPEWPTDPPQVLSVPPASYRSVTDLVGLIAERLAAESSTPDVDIPPDRPVQQTG